MRLVRSGLLILVPTLLLATGSGGEPRLESLEPAAGLQSRSTLVRVRGEGFTPQTRLLLAPGDTVHRVSLKTSVYPWNVVVTEGRAYVIGTGGLAIFDVTDPSGIVKLAEVAIRGIAIQVRDGIAHVLGTDGFRIVDVRNPAGPRILGFLPIFQGARVGSDVALSGGLAFVSHGARSVSIIDISDPARPGLVTRFSPPGGIAHAYALEAAGDILYVAGSGPALSIFDVSMPEAPVLLSTYDRPHTPGTIYYNFGTGLKVADGVAYLATYFTGLDVVDVRDPTRPVRLGTTGTGHASMDVAVLGSEAYLSSYGSITVVDIRDPRHLRLEAEVYPPAGYRGQYSGLAASSAGVFVCDPPYLHVYTIAPRQPPRTGPTLPTPDQLILDLDVARGIAYLAGYGLRGGLGALLAVDVRDHERILPLGRFGSLAVVSVDVEGDLACAVVEDKIDGLSATSLIDVSRPESMSEIRTFTVDTGGNSWALISCALADERLFIATAGSIEIYGRGGPDPPVHLSRLTLPAIPRSMIVQGDHLFIAASEAGLLVADDRDPSAPVLVGRLPTFGTALDLSIEGEVLYLADGVGGFLTISIREPSSPVILGRIPGWLPCSTVDVQGPWAVVSAFLQPRDAGLDPPRQVVPDAQYLLDVRDPEAPRLAAGLGWQHGPASFSTTGVAWVAAGWQGFLGHDLDPFTGLTTAFEDSSTMTLTVPPGFSSGRYHVIAVDPESGRWDRLDYAFDVLADQDGDGFSPPADCDDEDPAVHPGAVDWPGNGRDEDCDGSVSCGPAGAWRSPGELATCVVRACTRLRADGHATGTQCGAILSGVLAPSQRDR